MSATEIVSVDARPLAERAEWFGQPKGLTILFLTDMWEQFSYYGMRALLVYYMTKGLHYRQSDASLLYGVYTALVFFTPLIGGVIADRWLGARRAVILGGIIIAIGHFAMVFAPLFFGALLTIALGCGLFTPSMPAQINSLYAADDPRRSSAYNIFYAGINLGSFLAPLVAGTLGEIYGFHYGFSIAGVGMLLGLATYIAGTRYLAGPVGVRPSGTKRTEYPTDTGQLWPRLRLLSAVALCVVIFRTAYEQNGNTVALMIDAGTDRHLIGSFFIPATWFLPLNPLVVLAFTPFLVRRWNKLADAGRGTSSINRMMIGAALVGVSYTMLGLATQYAQLHGTKLAWPWMAGFFVLMTVGELYILPVGLGLFGRLAPAGFTATLIAVWYSAGFLGNLFAGWLGGYWSALEHSSFFMVVGLVAFVSALTLAPLRRPVTALEKRLAS